MNHSTTLDPHVYPCGTCQTLYVDDSLISTSSSTYSYPISKFQLLRSPISTTEIILQFPPAPGSVPPTSVLGPSLHPCTSRGSQPFLQHRFCTHKVNTQFLEVSFKNLSFNSFHTAQPLSSQISPLIKSLPYSGTPSVFSFVFQIKF